MIFREAHEQSERGRRNAARGAANISRRMKYTNPLSSYRKEMRGHEECTSNVPQPKRHMTMTATYYTTLANLIAAITMNKMETQPQVLLSGDVLHVLSRQLQMPLLGQSTTVNP